MSGVSNYGPVKAHTALKTVHHSFNIYANSCAALAFRCGDMHRKLVVVLPNLLRGMGVRRNSAETQHSGHDPRSGPKVKNESRAKNGVLERLK